MGCVHSRHDINDQHPNIFQVVNVDDLGYRFSAAMLEVTEAHLVLHQRGRAAIRWPLRCLRRYGFDAELFSFESGRRCPTGPGIYAFRCRRAEALFNMLQLQIQNITDDNASRDLTAFPVQVHGNEGRELMHNESINSGPAEGGSTDPDGYLEPLPRPHTRGMNNVGAATTIGVPSTNVNSSAIVSGGGAVGGVTSGAGNSVPHIARGNTVGICGLRTMHSPASPPTPLSPPPVPFENNHDLSQTDEPPPSLTHEVREVPPSPTETVRPVCVNLIEKVVTYENRLGRSTSCGNSYPERSLLQGNSIQSKRPRSYVNVNSNKPHYEMNEQVYVNIVTEIREHDHHNHNEHVYVNLRTEKEVPAVPPRLSLTAGSAGSGSSHSGTTTTTDTDHQPSQLNYCILDLDPGSDSSQAAPLSPLGSVASGPESPRRKEPYVTIDFSRTAALKTAKQAWEDESRRTRHNSTFTSPASLIRHNSSLSD